MCPLGVVGDLAVAVFEGLALSTLVDAVHDATGHPLVRGDIARWTVEVPPKAEHHWFVEKRDVDVGGPKAVPLAIRPTRLATSHPNASDSVLSFLGVVLGGVLTDLHRAIAALGGLHLPKRSRVSILVNGSPSTRAVIEVFGKDQRVFALTTALVTAVLSGAGVFVAAGDAVFNGLGVAATRLTAIACAGIEVVAVGIGLALGAALVDADLGQTIDVSTTVLVQRTAGAHRPAAIDIGFSKVALTVVAGGGFRVSRGGGFDRSA